MIPIGDEPPDGGERADYVELCIPTLPEAFAAWQAVVASWCRLQPGGDAGRVAGDPPREAGRRFAEALEEHYRHPRRCC